MEKTPKTPADWIGFRPSKRERRRLDIARNKLGGISAAQFLRDAVIEFLQLHPTTEERIAAVRRARAA
jgi:hypothetical protein